MENQLNFEICKPKILNDWIEYFILFIGSGFLSSTIYSQPFSYIIFNSNIKLTIRNQDNNFNTEKSVIDTINLQPIKLEVDFDRQNEIFGIKIQPCFLYLLTEIPLNLLSGKIYRIDELFKSYTNEIIEKINCANGIIEKSIIVENFLINEIKYRKKTQIQMYLNAVKLLNESYFSETSIDNLLQNINVSHRSLDRQFLKYIGITPKSMLSLIRFQKILNYYQSEKKLDFDTILKFGFYDYAHFSKEFNKYTGQTFTTFKQETKIGEKLQVKNRKVNIYLPEISFY